MKALFFCLLLFSLGSCRKDKPAPPKPFVSLADKVAGNYIVYDTVFTNGTCPNEYTSFAISIAKRTDDTITIIPFHCSDTLYAVVTDEYIRINSEGTCYYDRLYGTLAGDTVYFTYTPGFEPCWIEGRATAIKQ